MSLKNTIDYYNKGTTRYELTNLVFVSVALKKLNINNRNLMYKIIQTHWFIVIKINDVFLFNYDAFTCISIYIDEIPKALILPSFTPYMKEQEVIPKRKKRFTIPIFPLTCVNLCETSFPAIGISKQ